MKRILLIAASITLWIAIGLYLVWAGRLTQEQSGIQPLKDISIEVTDSADMGVITAAMVRLWLETGGIPLRNVDVRSLPTEQIEQMILGRGYVASCRVWTDLGGTLSIRLRQRHPAMRFSTRNGYNFYVTSDRRILPLQAHWTGYVPIVTGNFDIPFSRSFTGSLETVEKEKKSEENWLFFNKLINFVESISDDNFLSSLIEQIHVVQRPSGDPSGKWQEPEIEIVPRVGDCIVMLGGIDAAPQRLKKLTRLYGGVRHNEWWKDVRYVDLRYRGQVVCSR